MVGFKSLMQGPLTVKESGGGVEEFAHIATCSLIALHPFCSAPCIPKGGAYQVMASGCLSVHWLLAPPDGRAMLNTNRVDVRPKRMRERFLAHWPIEKSTRSRQLTILVGAIFIRVALESRITSLGAA